MNKKFIKEKIEEYILKHNPQIDLNQLNENRPFATILGMDSIAFVNFIFDMENLFNHKLNSPKVLDISNNLSTFIKLIELEFNAYEF